MYILYVKSQITDVDGHVLDTQFFAVDTGFQCVTSGK